MVSSGSAIRTGSTSISQVRRSYGRQPDTTSAMIVATSSARSSGERRSEAVMARGRWAAIIGLFWGGLFCGGSSAAERLPAVHALADEWTVSGLSSGAYMAVQVAVAHSRAVRGVGVFAGGPYYCVGLDPRRAEGECMKGAPAASASRREAERLASLRLIDDVANLRTTRSWALAGGADDVVAEPVVRAAAEFFAAYNAAGAFLAVEPGLGHGLPTNNTGGACAASASPFLNRCGFDGAERMLAHLLPGAAAAPGAKGALTRFDQTEFIPLLRRMWGTSSLDATGFVYMPEQCRGQ